MIERVISERNCRGSSTGRMLARIVDCKMYCFRKELIAIVRFAFYASSKRITDLQFQVEIVVHSFGATSTSSPTRHFQESEIRQDVIQLSAR